jgi:hypothetical protein
MRFQVFSRKAEQALSNFLILTEKAVDSSMMQKKLELCNNLVYLIADDEPYPKREKLENPKISNLINAWRSLRSDGMSDLAVQKTGWQEINTLGIAFGNSTQKNNPVVWQLRNDNNEGEFFILLTGLEPDGLPKYELLLLSNLYQVMQGSLPIHCSGVVHRSELFLFAGHSGAGKSTIAEFSWEIGDRVLDDDQILVNVSSGSGPASCGWAGRYTECEKKPRGIFKIVQDTKDEIIPMEQHQVARFIMDRSSEILGDCLPPAVTRRMFGLSSELARSLPGFELHFRKSADFWKIIENEMNGNKKDFWRVVPTVFHN